MTDISIVGGGITGLAIACLTTKSVEVFEASKNLGGILRDLSSKGNYFFSACQYFNGESSWLHQMGIDKALYEFDHIYGSYTDLFGKKTTSNSFAGPVYEGLELIHNKSESFHGSSLAERCDLYPINISTQLKKWFRHIGVDVDMTHHSVITGFQASRIYALGQEEKMKELKDRDGLADRIYGLPRNVVSLSSIKSFLPKRGFNDLFDKHINQNPKKRYERNTTVDFDILNDRIVLKTKRGSFEPNQVIWTGDPTKLASKAFGIKLDSQKFSAEVLAGFLDSSVDNPFYIQTYSMESKVMRIFLYNIKGRGCFTIEKGFDDVMTSQVVRFCQTVINSFLPRKIAEVVIRKKNIRFFAYTIKDYNVLFDLKSQVHIKNLITPDYLSYGRDEKIDSVMDQLCRH